MYQSIQFIKHCTRDNDAIIMTGDFNHKSNEIGVVAMTELISLRDTYLISEKKVIKYTLRNEKIIARNEVRKFVRISSQIQYCHLRNDTVWSHFWGFLLFYPLKDCRLSENSLKGENWCEKFNILAKIRSFLMLVYRL